MWDLESSLELNVSYPCFVSFCWASSLACWYSLWLIIYDCHVLYIGNRHFVTVCFMYFPKEKWVTRSKLRRFCFLRVKNRERPSTWVRLYLYQTVLGQGSFSQMELFSSIWRKHSTDSPRVALFFHAQRLKDSGIHSQILPSPICQDITKQELLTKNQGNFPEMYTYPPPGTNQKNNAWSSKKTTIHSDESFKCLVNSPASLWPCRRDSFVPCGCRKERIWRPCRGSRWRWSPRDFGS